MTKKTEIAPWQERMAAEAKQVARTERPQLSQISTRGGMLSYGGAPINGNSLDCIVVAYVFENDLFDYPFDADNPRNPDCYATSLPPMGDEPLVMTHHSQVVKPRADACHICPNSKPPPPDPRTGKKKGKPCKEIRKLGLLPVSALTSAAAVKTAEVAILRIPVTSVKNWKLYVNEATARSQRPPYGIITTVAPKPHPKNQFEITFKMAGVVADEFMPEVINRIPGVADLLLQPYEPNPEAPTDNKKF